MHLEHPISKTITISYANIMGTDLCEAQPTSTSPILLLTYKNVTVSF